MVSKLPSGSLNLSLSAPVTSRFRQLLVARGVWLTGVALDSAVLMIEERSREAGRV